MAADYSMTADLLASCAIDRSVSEIHGVLTGQLCAGGGPFDRALTLEILAFDAEVPEVVNNLLDMLAEDIRRQLQAADYAFQLLLPDDDTDLQVRLAALTDWCDGFTAGFAGAWIRDDGAMSPETREVLGDFTRIAQVDQEDEEADEKENEVNFMEIVEYARMAAITVYLQNNPQAQAAVSLDVPDDNIH